MRGAIAALMSRGREIHYHVSTDIDLGATVAWLEQRNLERPVTDRLLPIAALLKAAALAARRTPEAEWLLGGRPVPRRRSSAPRHRDIVAVGWPRRASPPRCRHEGCRVDHGDFATSSAEARTGRLRRSGDGRSDAHSDQPG